MNKLILTARGLNTGMGRELIGRKIRKNDLSNKKIFIFHEPYLCTELPIMESCIDIGFEEKNIIFSKDNINENDIINCDYFYCGEGNPFIILSKMRERNFDVVIKSAFLNYGDKIYVGASAGAAIASASIEEMLNFDSNTVKLDDFRGLGFFDGILIPHYTKHELKNFIKNSPGITYKYNKIINISNDDCIVLDV